MLHNYASVILNAIIFYLLLPFLYLISIQPFFILYIISDGLYFFLYYVIRYRRSVVLTNLIKSFPAKNEREIVQISKAFYRSFCDLLVESFKSITISKREQLKRCSFENLEMLQKLYEEKKSLIGVLGHYGNWEWAAPSFSLLLPYKLCVIYNPLSNKYFDKLMYKIRSRYGTALISFKDTSKALFRNRSTLCTTIFVSDQNPHVHNAQWVRFLHQDTPIYRGVEIVAKKFNLPVVFVSVRREKRGFYKIHTEMLTDQPLACYEGEISEMHTKKLEQEIIRQPELWLWSHRRWKHNKPEHVHINGS